MRPKKKFEAVLSVSIKIRINSRSQNGARKIGLKYCDEITKKAIITIDGISGPLYSSPYLGGVVEIVRPRRTRRPTNGGTSS